MGDDDQDSGFRRRHTPEFAQQALRALSLFQPVADDDPVEQGVLEGQPLFLHQRSKAFFLGRPADRALVVGGGGNNAARACPVALQKSVGMAVAQHIEPVRLGPQGAHAARHHLLRHAPER